MLGGCDFNGKDTVTEKQAALLRRLEKQRNWDRFRKEPATKEDDRE